MSALRRIQRPVRFSRLSRVLGPAIAPRSSLCCSFSTSRPHRSDVVTSVMSVMDGEVLINTGRWLGDMYMILNEKSMVVGSYSFQVFNFVHTLTGLSWGYVIPITCVLLRVTMTLPVSFWSRKNAERSNKLSDVVLSSAAVIGNAARQRALVLLPKSFDRKMVPDTSDPPKVVDAFFAQPEGVPTKASVMAFLKDYSAELGAKFNTSAYKTYAVAVSQMVILFFGSRGVAYYSSVRSDDMQVLNPGTYYSDQGMLWFPNLDVVDPFMVLPLMFTATTFFNVEGYVREADAANQFRKVPRSLRTSLMFVVSRMGGLFLVSLSFFYPSSYTIYWLTSALYSVVQNAFMRRYYPFVPVNRETKPLNKPNSQRVILEVDELALKELLGKTIPKSERI